MNTYQAFYNDKSIQVQAETSYQAQQKAAEIFKARKSYQVDVFLIAKEDGVEIIHSGAELS